jgi:protein required for attachment to host cells
MNRQASPLEKLKIRHGDWVVVCDGSKALILENRGDEKFPNLRETEVRHHQGSPTHELGAHAPGRVYQSVGGSRSSVEQTDLHDVAERKFLLTVVAVLLEKALVPGNPRRLFIVAPPRALGVLRGGYSPAVRAAIGAELDKDWVKLPIDEIERRLFA